MLTLYHSPDSRSSRFIWLLDELGVEHEVVYCDIKRRSGRGAPDARNPHPEKRVPALLHDDTLVTEQAAIALYLTDTFSEAGLGVEAGAPSRAAYLGWLAFYAGEAGQSMRRGHLRRPPRSHDAEGPCPGGGACPPRSRRVLIFWATGSARRTY